VTRLYDEFPRSLILASQPGQQMRIATRTSTAAIPGIYALAAREVLEFDPVRPVFHIPKRLGFEIFELEEFCWFAETQRMAPRGTPVHYFFTVSDVRL
jgi:hypothetical protein